MYARQACSTLQRLARGFPILALTGPRQSGKTTLARACFPDKPYVSLENPDERDFAEQDPKRFLARFPGGRSSTRCSVARPCFPGCRAWSTRARSWGNSS